MVTSHFNLHLLLLRGKICTDKKVSILYEGLRLYTIAQVIVKADRGKRLRDAR